MSENAVCISLNLSPREIQRWYAGEAQVVETHALDGRVVRFPAKILQSFVARDGVKGVFKITYDASGKFQEISRLAV